MSAMSFQWHTKYKKANRDSDRITPSALTLPKKYKNPPKNNLSQLFNKIQIKSQKYHVMILS